MKLPDLIELVLSETAAQFGLPVGALTGRSRVYRIIKARHIAEYILRNFAGLTYPHIGEVFNKDHQTVIYGVRCAKERYTADILEVTNRVKIRMGDNAQQGQS